MVSNLQHQTKLLCRYTSTMAGFHNFHCDKPCMAATGSVCVVFHSIGLEIWGSRVLVFQWLIDWGQITPGSAINLEPVLQLACYKLHNISQFVVTNHLHAASFEVLAKNLLANQLSDVEIRVGACVMLALYNTGIMKLLYYHHINANAMSGCLYCNTFVYTMLQNSYSQQCPFVALVLIYTYSTQWLY